MKIIIFGVLCLWHASVDGARSAKTNAVAVEGDDPHVWRRHDRDLKNGQSSEGGDKGATYIGVLVDTTPIKQQAQASASASTSASASAPTPASASASAPTPASASASAPSPASASAPNPAQASTSRPRPANPLPFFTPKSAGQITPPSQNLRQTSNPLIPSAPGRQMSSKQALGPQMPMGDPYGQPLRQQMSMGNPYAQPLQRPAPQYAPGPRIPQGQGVPADLFKLEAYLTKDGRVVNGRLASAHDNIHGTPHAEGHQYITPHPTGVRLNRPGIPAQYPFSPMARPPPPQPLFAPQSRPYSPQPRPYAPQPRPYAPFPQPRPFPPYPQPRPYAPQPRPYAPQPRPYAPYPQPYPPHPQPYPPHPQPYPPHPQPYAPHPQPAYAHQPQQGQMTRPELDTITNNIVESSIGPNGERLSPQLVSDIVKLLNREVLVELAEGLMNKDGQPGPPRTDPSDPNYQAYSYLGNLINQQLDQNVGHILQQMSSPSAPS